MSKSTQPEQVRVIDLSTDAARRLLANNVNVTSSYWITTKGD